MMKPQNAIEIKNKSKRFILLFIIMVSFGIITVYGYFRLAAYEVELLNKTSQKYDAIIGIHQTLTGKMDSINYYLGLLNTDKIASTYQLQLLISNEKERMYKIMESSEDTLGHFIVYDKILYHLNTILALKDSIRNASEQEEFLRKDLLLCIKNNQQLQKQLNTTSF